MFSKSLCLLLLVAVFQRLAQAEKFKIRVMTYNIFQFGSVIGDWDEAERLNQLAPALTSLAEQPDVIIFQEVFSNAALTYIQSNFRPTYPHQTAIVGHKCEKGNDWHSLSGKCSNGVAVTRGGVMIISKFPIQRKHQHVFVASRGADFYSNKGAVYVDLVGPKGNIIHIVGTQLQAQVGPTNHQIRMDQLQEIRSWLNSFAIPANEPIILVGDLNVESTNEREKKDMIQYARATLVDLSSSSKVTSYSTSTNLMAKTNSVYYKSSPIFDNTLDYLMIYTGHLQPKSTSDGEILQLKNKSPMHWDWLKANVPGSNGEYRDISGHYPVVSTFIF